MDIIRRRDRFIVWSGKEQMSFQQFKDTLYDEDEWTADVFEPALLYITSRITKDFHILSLIYGLLFGFFYSRNISYVIAQLQLSLRKRDIVVLVTFSLLVAFWQISSFRFWFAAHVFFYGVMPFLRERKANRIYLSLLTPFIHFSFLFAVVPLVAYLLFGNRLTVYFIFYIVTIFVAEVDMTFLKPAFDFLPGVFEKQVEGYTSESYVEIVKELNAVKLNWYAAYKNQIIHLFVMIFLVLGFVFNNQLLRFKCNSIASFTLLFLAFSQIFKSIPSMERFLVVGYLFAFTLILLFSQFSRGVKWFNVFLICFVWGLVLWSIVEMRNGFDTMSMASVFSNAFFAPFLHEVNFSLIDLFK